MPTLRARLLRLGGASVGRNVRVSECRFINLSRGFSNLTLGDDVFLGADCLVDLEGRVDIGTGTTLSPRVTLLSHADPGSAHASPLVQRYPPCATGIRVGEHCWLGSGAVVLAGVVIADRTVVGAGSVVNKSLPGDSTYAGVPARLVRTWQPGDPATSVDASFQVGS